MTKLTIDLDNYSKADQDLMKSMLRKFDAVDGKDGFEITWDSNHYQEKNNPFSNPPTDGKPGDPIDYRCYAYPIEKEDAIWKPDQYQGCYFVNPEGTITYNPSGKYTVTTMIPDTALKLGNVFKTSEAAQRMADRRKRIGIFENKMMEFADGYEFDHGYATKNNWYPSYEDGQWCVANTRHYNPLMICMTYDNSIKAMDWANEHYPEGL